MAYGGHTLSFGDWLELVRRLARSLLDNDLDGLRSWHGGVHTCLPSGMISDTMCQVQYLGEYCLQDGHRPQVSEDFRAIGDSS